jgi:hypothetical protein
MDRHFNISGEAFYFWKNLILIVIFFTVTPLALATSLFSLIAYTNLDNLNIGIPKPTLTSQSGAKVFASLPTILPSIGDSITTQDARVEIVRQYLDAYRSPLEPIAPFIVYTSDKYGLDYRLTTAIAQQESNLCKVYPEGSYNCWGWGIHSQGSLGFSSYEEALDEVSRGLREEYLDKGFVTVEEIMSKYTPLSNGSWADGVNKFLSEMQ